ncbi:MICOS complex subunit MIC27 [Diachasmimorpha longicaudata]|uniref:MICOS complex subunit MIC27 n=1 Tax=Diachasmimorpha longicaudata TaxID=58733 RepID=UPI0030B8765B
MERIQLFKKFLMPGGLCAAVPMAKPQPASPDKPVECSNEILTKPLIRPSELPIYVYESGSQQVPRVNNQDSSSMLEQGFGTIRKNVQAVLNEYTTVTTTVSDKFQTGVEHSQLMLEYLREETNTLPRVGAVAIGGLTGLIFSLRGGKFKRFVYTTTGALGIAAVCYPRQTEASIVAAKHYANIVINFAYGVKPGEKQMEIPWPELPLFKMPSSFSDIINIVSETGSSVVSSVGSLGSKLTDGAQEQKTSAEAVSPQLQNKKE